MGLSSMIMNLLSNNGYIIVNKAIIQKIGLHEAIILGEMCSEYIYWKNANRLEDNFFYSTRENIQSNTGLSPYQQRQPFKNLADRGIILTKEKGMPQKTWYSIDETTLYQLLLETDLISDSEETSQQDLKKLEDKTSRNCIPSCEEIGVHDVKELDTNNNNNNIKNNNNILSNLISNFPDEIDEMDYDQLFKKNIEYEILIQDNRNKELIENITNIAVEAINSTKDVLYINSEPKSKELVKSQLLKLKPNHIEYVVNCLRQNVKDVKSIKSYILTTLYNSINTIGVDATLVVAKIMNE